MISNDVTDTSWSAQFNEFYIEKFDEYHTRMGAEQVQIVKPGRAR